MNTSNFLVIRQAITQRVRDWQLEGDTAAPQELLRDAIVHFKWLREIRRTTLTPSRTI